MTFSEATDTPVSSFASIWKPTRPYASNDLLNGVRRHPRALASGMRFIEVNASAAQNLIVVDVDEEHASTLIKSRVWDDELTPEPNYITTNPGSTHAQAIYTIKGSIAGGTQADAYLQHTTRRVTAALGGDPSYGGLIMRNPALHIFEQLTDQLYTLKELNAGTQVSDKSALVYSQEKGEGRNLDLFNSLRVFAYREARRVNYDTPTLLSILEERATELNLSQNLNNPKGLLPQAELNSIARSIVKFIARRFSSKSFSDLQQARASKRWEKTAEDRLGRLETILFLRDDMTFSWGDISATIGGTPAALRKAYSRAKSTQKGESAP